MFDNINPSVNEKSNQGGGSKPAAADTGKGNFPGGQGGVTDMFEEIELPTKPEIFKPKESAQEGLPGSLPAEVIDNGSVGKKVLNILVVIMGLAFLLGGGYYGYQFYKSRITANSSDIVPVETLTPTDNNANIPAETDTDSTVNEVPADTNTTVAPEAETATSAATTEAETKDTDQDGVD